MMKTRPTGRSKTANILFALEFDRRYYCMGVRATAVHAGAILTGTVVEMIEGPCEAIAAYYWKTVPEGAATALWAGVVATARDVGAQHCEDCHVAEVNDDANSRVAVHTYALDSDNAKALWATSEALVRETF